MAESGYKQFSPVAMAAEILCSRWTVLVLRELIVGSTRFNDLRRGLPRMSPALLSKRLRELEAAGIVHRTAEPGRPGTGGVRIVEYTLTPAGRELTPVIESIGVWGQRWVESKPTLDNLDPQLLMWDIRRNLRTDPMPKRRNTIQSIYPDLPAEARRWWLVVEPGEEVDLCSVDPGFDVDLYVTADLRSMTAIWLGLDRISRARDEERLVMTGSRQLENAIESWIGQSRFADVEKIVA